jgi:hypothetical protein
MLEPVSEAATRLPAQPWPVVLLRGAIPQLTNNGHGGHVLSFEANLLGIRANAGVRLV